MWLQFLRNLRPTPWNNQIISNCFLSLIMFFFQSHIKARKIIIFNLLSWLWNQNSFCWRKLSSLSKQCGLSITPVVHPPLVTAPALYKLYNWYYFYDPAPPLQSPADRSIVNIIHQAQVFSNKIFWKLFSLLIFANIHI